MNKFLTVFALVIGLVGFSAYYFVLDGSIPRHSSFELNIEAIRSLADAQNDQLPSQINVEILARNAAPVFALRAGGGFADTFMTRAVFQIETPNGFFLLEAGMDEELAEQYGQSENFSSEVWQTIQLAMSAAKGIFVTHEHPDHMGGLVRHPDLQMAATKAILTDKQYEGLGRLSRNQKLPAEFENIAAPALNEPRSIAPGIVMIPSPGHTPGSTIIYVKLATGSEFLFIGDIAYTFENVKEAVDRPRFLRFLMHDPENRAAVVNQLSALNALLEKEPAIQIVPAHADVLLTELMRSGLLGNGFNL